MCWPHIARKIVENHNLFDGPDGNARLDKAIEVKDMACELLHLARTAEQANALIPLFKEFLKSQPRFVTLN